MRLILTALFGAMIFFVSPVSAEPVWNTGWNFDKYEASIQKQGRRAQQPRAQRTATRQSVDTYRAKRIVKVVRRGRTVYVARYVDVRRPQRPQQESQHARLAPAIAREPVAQITRGGVDVARATIRTAVQFLPHPAGCPRTLFCGCGAALEIFGSTRPAGMGNLWHVSGWLRMPRAAPAPGMAAVNSRHVFVIKQVLGNGKVLAYDANSGGGRTRLHVRSLTGFTVVNPRSRAG